MGDLLIPKVTVILRGYDTKQVLTVIEHLVGTRLSSVEVTSNSPNFLESIRIASREFGEDVLIGAGTITDFELAKQSIDAGASYLLSPIMLSERTLAYAKENGAITVPAAFTPTEIMQSFKAGADIVKVFPACTLGPKYITDVQAPLGRMPLMVVGGINADNVQDYFDAGATYAGIGSGIFNPSDIVQRNVANIRNSIKRLENSIAW